MKIHLAKRITTSINVEAECGKTVSPFFILGKHNFLQLNDSERCKRCASIALNKEKIKKASRPIDFRLAINVQSYHGPYVGSVVNSYDDGQIIVTKSHDNLFFTDGTRTYKTNLMELVDALFPDKEQHNEEE